MSMFTVSGEVRNVYHQPGTIDKATGEVKPGSDKVQILGTMPVSGGGEKEDIITLTIPEGLDFKPYLKQSVTVPLGFFSPSKGQIIYFIPKGSTVVLNGSSSPLSQAVETPKFPPVRNPLADRD